jgi:outer membrane protein TolC
MIKRMLMMQKKYNSTKRWAYLLALLALQSFAQAQSSTTLLTLNEAVAAATQQNQNIALAKLDEQIAASNYRQTQAVYLPQVNASYTALSTNNPLNVFGFKLQQQQVQQQDFNPSLLNHPGSTPDFVAQLTVQQPLVNMDMVYLRKSALVQTQAQQYKTQRTAQYIAWQVKQAYLQLQFAYDAEKVLQQALQTATAIYKFTSDRYQQGLLQKYDLLNVQVLVKTIETNIALATSNIKNASDYLSLLMNRPQGMVYTTTAATGDEQNAADTLPAARADFRAMEAAIQSYGLMIRSSKMAYLPKLNAFANYQLHDKSMLGFGGGGYLAGIQLSWDIFKGFTTKNKIATQTLEQNKLTAQLQQQKEEGRTEINKTSRAVADAAYNIAQQQQAVEQSAEALRILQNRYSQGLVNTTDVLMAQTQLWQQQLAQAQAVFAKNNALAYLQFLTAVNQ